MPAGGEANGPNGWLFLSRTHRECIQPFKLRAFRTIAKQKIQLSAPSGLGWLVARTFVPCQSASRISWIRLNSRWHGGALLKAAVLSLSSARTLPGSRLEAPILMRPTKSWIYSKTRWLLLKSTSRHSSPNRASWDQSPATNPDSRWTWPACRSSVPLSTRHEMRQVRRALKGTVPTESSCLR